MGRMTYFNHLFPFLPRQYSWTLFKSLRVIKTIVADHEDIVGLRCANRLLLIDVRRFGLGTGLGTGG